MKLGILFGSSVFILLALGSCSVENANTLSQAMAAIGVSSLTAASSSRSDRFNLFQPWRLLRDDGTPSNVKPLEDIAADVAEFQTGDPDTKAAELGNPLSFTTHRAPCFGPSWEDDAVVGGYDRPSGDLGIVYSTASNTNNTACVAAQLNALLGGTPSLVNNFVKMQAIMIAAASDAGKTLPVEGETQDNTAVMPTISGLTIDSATLEKLDDGSGNAVYKTVFEFTDTATHTGTITIHHKPTNETNTEFTGIFQAILPQPPANLHRGISLVYSQTDSTLSFALRTAANQSSSDIDFFAASGLVDFTKDAYEADGHYMIASHNKDTNEGIAHYAWQAGENDGAARAFGVYIPAGTEGSLTGTGYFGFGDDIASIVASNASATTPWMEDMHCNWTGAGGSGGGSGGNSVVKVQRQGMTQSGGIFGVNASFDNWEFAPTNTCDRGTDWTVADNMTPNFLEGTHSQGVPANDLATVPSNTDLPTLTAPTFTIPSR